MTAYYNENDPKAAAWLRELIKQDLIAPGLVDDRSIEDIQPDDLREFRQCHFFAGIGVWSYALRRAGWPDGRPVWTGSCPCQPFSVIGTGTGFDDERHLWPTWAGLIRKRGPGVIFGEQVASKAGLGWFDAVQTDLENAAYAVGSADLCAAGVGAPHIRSRLYFAAQRLGDAVDTGLERYAGNVDDGNQSGRLDPIEDRPAAQGGSDGGLADAGGGSGEGHAGAVSGAQTENEGRGLEHRGQPDRYPAGREDGELAAAGRERQAPTDEPGPTNGFWCRADWLGCRDDKFRAVEPGTFPLADGTPERVGLLRGYGNAINAEVARAFIESYMAI